MNSKRVAGTSPARPSCIREGAASLAGRLGRDTSGNISVIFGLSAMILFGVTGGAVDVARWYGAQSQVRSALDSAVLAGGRAIQVSGSSDPSVAIAAAQTYFDKLKPASVTGGSSTFTVIDNSTALHGEVNAQISTPFLHVMGIPYMTVHAVAEAVLAAGGNAETNVEVSLMLDITGSMSGQKIEDMKTAAKDLIDIVVWNDQTLHTSKVALAPFAPFVNVSTYASTATGLPATKVFGGSTKKLIRCVTEREGPEAFTDAAPGPGAYVRAYRSNNDQNDSNNYNDDGSCSNPSSAERIRPLSNDKTLLKSRIDGFSASGSTAGLLGASWAWYLISPKWSSIWPAASKPAPYSDITTLGPSGKPKLQKIVVLMTDGIFNTYGGQNYGDNSSMANTVSQNTVTLCTNMKATGIKVYTVGFDLGGSQLAIDTLKACASSEPTDPPGQPSYFYNTSTGDQLRSAFRDIALKIASLRIRA